GAFCGTDLGLILRNRGIATLLVAGVTTEVCVHTTIREANDRGFRCVAIADACASYFPEFHAAGLAMIKAQGGIFGWVARSAAVLAALASAAVPGYRINVSDTTRPHGRARPGHDGDAGAVFQVNSKT
ncbi:MAG: cysteine hydrolase, partial [Acetobacteraceae bacterium]